MRFCMSAAESPLDERTLLPLASPPPPAEGEVRLVKVPKPPPPGEVARDPGDVLVDDRLRV
jgi:hypothetical protein